MIQINLLPDIKRQHLRAQRTRNIVIAISMLLSAIAIGIVVVMYIGLGATKVITGNTISDNKKIYQEIADTDDINKLITIQNQLTKIEDLQNTRSVKSRLFAVLTAIAPAKPADVKFTSVTVSPNDSSMKIDAVTTTGYKTIESMKKKIQNAKMTYYDNKKDAPDKQEMSLIQDGTTVAVSDTGYGESDDGKVTVNFSLSFVYSKGLYNNTTKDIAIVLPEGEVDVTDSKKRLPESLFTNKEKKKEEEK